MKTLTGAGAIINTSLNMHGKPMSDAASGVVQALAGKRRGAPGAGLGLVDKEKPDPALTMTTPARFYRIFWFCCALVVLVATAFWACRIVAGKTLEEQLKVVPLSTVWGMHACVIAAIAGLGRVAVPLAKILGRRRGFTALGLLVAGYLATGLAPRTTRILFDEHLYMQIGQTLAHTGRAEGANYARVEYGQFEMYDAWVNKQPNGLPYLLSWIYRVVGVSDNASHFLNRALVGIASAALYIALAVVPWALPAGAGLAAAPSFPCSRRW